MRTALLFMAALCGAAALAAGCGGGEDEGTAPEDSGKALRAEAAVKPAGGEEKAPVEAKAVPGRVLLVTQSNFKANAEGKYTVPDAAAMLLVGGEGVSVEKIEDPESNVFHKAIQYGEEGILTIGANEAMLKLWNRKDGRWTAETLWHPTFGGKHNRLRDFELADFDGDGRDDLAIATHDQGVVAVVWRTADGWRPEEIDRKEETFVHEIEVGDLDGDGKLEIFSTPSQPNTASGHGQGGAVTRFAWTGERFEKSSVVELADRHVKEILVADVDGDGRKELYAALEAQMGEGGKIEAPVEIRRYDWKDGGFEETKVMSIEDRFCRFLLAGDPDGDGDTELVAAAFSAGVWVIEEDKGSYSGKCIDSKTGGFEHAAYLADMDGDAKQELYVADDKGGVLRRYVHRDGAYVPTVINKRLVPGQAMVWNITVADLD